MNKLNKSLCIMYLLLSLLYPLLLCGITNFKDEILNSMFFMLAIPSLVLTIVFGYLYWNDAQSLLSLICSICLLYIIYIAGWIFPYVDEIKYKYKKDIVTAVSILFALFIVLEILCIYSLRKMMDDYPDTPSYLEPPLSRKRSNSSSKSSRKSSSRKSSKKLLPTDNNPNLTTGENVGGGGE